MTLNLNPEGAVYGTLAIGAILAAESARTETYFHTVAAIVIAMVLYWLTHAYSDYAAERWRGGEKQELGGLAQMLVEEVSILLSAGVPLIAVLISWAYGASLGTALTAAIWTSVVMVVVIEVAAGLDAKLSRVELIKQAGIGVTLSVLLIVLKLLLH